MHLLRSLRRHGAVQRLPKLRRRICSTPHQAGDRAAAGLSLVKRPASTERVYLSYDKDEIDRFARIVRDIPPESR
jgi:hypothetical protein